MDGVVGIVDVEGDAVGNTLEASASPRSQSESGIREIRTSGSMNGEGKRNDAGRPKPPRPSSPSLGGALDASAIRPCKFSAPFRVSEYFTVVQARTSQADVKPLIFINLTRLARILHCLSTNRNGRSAGHVQHTASCGSRLTQKPGAKKTKAKKQ